MPDQRLFEQAIALHVTNIIQSSGHQFPYHNLEHTNRVVLHTRILTEHYGLMSSDAFVVMAAAWFHDVGHAYGVLTGHEEMSATIMQDFCNTIAVPPEQVKRIRRCILATQMPTDPTNLLEMILCDADTWHLGTPLFQQTDIRVQQEMEMRLGKPLLNWHEKTLAFMEHHKYYTTYCRQHLAQGKAANIDWLKGLIA